MRASCAIWIEAAKVSLPEPANLLLADDGATLAKQDSETKLKLFDEVFAQALDSADFMVIDTPGGDTELSRAASTELSARGDALPVAMPITEIEPRRPPVARVLRAPQRTSASSSLAIIPSALAALPCFPAAPTACSQRADPRTLKRARTGQRTFTHARAKAALRLAPHAPKRLLAAPACPLRPLPTTACTPRTGPILARACEQLGGA